MGDFRRPIPNAADPVLDRIRLRTQRRAFCLGIGDRFADALREKFVQRIRHVTLMVIDHNRTSPFNNGRIALPTANKVSIGGLSRRDSTLRSRCCPEKRRSMTRRHELDTTSMPMNAEFLYSA